MTLEELLGNINTPGWDWPEDDFSWLSSRSGLSRKESDGGYTSVFFIHGGRIREQAHIPHGNFAPDKFLELITKRVAGLDKASVNWSSDTGGGDCGFWVEGTRLPTEDDLHRLMSAREQQLKDDARAEKDIALRRKLFT
jgi:hypothetical protein